MMEDLLSSIPKPDPVLLATISVPGQPVPKGRARTRIVYPPGKKPFVHHYQEKETEEYENRIKRAARAVIGDMEPLDEKPLSVIVYVYLPIPESWPQKRKAAALRGDIRPLSRPDGDNFLKIACDGLNQVMWRDDSIITDMMVLKRYSEEPHMDIEVFG
jgi:Holliday junction resolvase RusA-like endonuclease